MPYGYATHTPHANSTDTPFQWLGGYGVYYDSDTDLHLTLHRAYSSKLKRFISPDPLGIDGGVNVYAMANRNPLYFVDPYGLSGLESSGSSSGMWDRFMGAVDSVGWKIESWADDNRAQTAANYAQDAASYQEYNSTFSTVRDYSQATRSVVDKVTTAFGVYGAYKTFVPAPKSVSTPYGSAVQGTTAEARTALQQVRSGAPVYRQGSFGVQNTADAQFWSLKNPASTQGYAGQMGMPSGSGSPNWMMGGGVRSGAPVITRPAPAGPGGVNLGGKLEGVVNPGGVQLDWFHMP